MLAEDPPDASTNAEFDALIADRAVHPVFQPIVALHDGRVVGYEALARGPAGSVFRSPQALFAHAARAGRLAELDWICRAAACRDALIAGLAWQLPLFVNVEPATLRVPPPPAVMDILRAAANRLQIVIEITERSISGDPAILLAAVAWLRGHGMRVALDDVGADPASLAMMPLINPDVIKLDSSVVHTPDRWPVADVINAVWAQVARTGAVILAEGIETPHHLTTAQAMGASLGQGWLFGHPGPLPGQLTPPGSTPPRTTDPATAASAARPR
ncbi:EAL domain-containing protein [Catellatospora sp. NPDC049609]|uniref:EAL domain-containing protein n=1 Tax=Catellatospora sp. NPDC049609 TaxID=3155505 RepID=UPI003434F7F7